MVFLTQILLYCSLCWGGTQKAVHRVVQPSFFFLITISLVHNYYLLFTPQHSTHIPSIADSVLVRPVARSRLQEVGGSFLFSLHSFRNVLRLERQYDEWEMIAQTVETDPMIILLNTNVVSSILHGGGGVMIKLKIIVMISST